MKGNLRNSPCKKAEMAREGKTSSQAAAAMDIPEDGQTTLTVHNILELGEECLGLRVVLTAKEGTYLGVINLVLPSSKRLSLEKVCNPKTGKRRLGLLSFFFHSIMNITVIGEDREAKERLLKDVYQEAQRGKQLLMKKIVPPHLVGQEEEGNSMDEDVLLGRVDYNPKDTFLPPPPGRIPRPSKWLVIDTLGDAFEKALEFIHSEKTISLGMEGRKLGRGGSVGWLTIATSDLIFLFDMAVIGPREAFEAGLRDVLMDGSILKVLHDCRPMEDLLHHQFNINLKNIFDTQAGEVYIYMMQHKGAAPSFVSGLPSLLIKYLKLAPQHVFFSHVREECSENDESVWFERPLSPHLCEGLARTVMYLRELRLVLLDLMLVDLAQITNLYLGTLRDKDSTTIACVEPHVVPWEVQKLSRTSHNNSIGVHDPYITYSKDMFKVLKHKK